MKWYVIKDGNNVDLILDHNTTSRVAWISKEDYEQTGEYMIKPEDVGIIYDDNKIIGEYGPVGNNDKGPISLLNQLKKDTDNWLGIKTRKDSYREEYNKYTINYSDYKARLITAEEIAKITGADKYSSAKDLGWNKENGDWFYFDGSGESWQTPPTTNKYGWLYDRTGNNCLNYNCMNNAIGSNTNGYWTASSHINHNTNAWYVGTGLSGLLNDSSVIGDAGYGVRPIITVSKSKFM